MTDAVASTQPVVREIGSRDTMAWTNFLSSHPDANLYHTPIWQGTLTEVFGHQPLYLMAEREGRISGILPLYLVQAPLLGSKLISLPYDIGSGGAVAADPASERLLVERAIAIARERKVNYLELRYGQPRDYLESMGFQKSEPVLISEMALGEEEAIWLQVEKDHRKAVQKAAKRGIEVREAVTLADFREFERVQLHVFRDFGTPPYGSNYFPTLWRNLQAPGHVKILLSYVDGACVGGLVLFGWGSNMVSKFAACLPHAVPLRAYAALYWRAIQLGISLGYKRMSWGTSSRDQTGLIEFKERWGAVTRPAVLYSLPVNGSIPDISKYYDSTGLERRVWRKLPLPLTQLGGGVLSRWFC
jgi:hypothetical protein